MSAPLARCQPHGALVPRPGHLTSRPASECGVDCGVLGALGHLASLLPFFVHREARRRADVSTAEDLAWARSRRSADLPPGLTLRWLGTAGYALAYQGFELL